MRTIGLTAGSTVQYISFSTCSLILGGLGGITGLTGKTIPVII
jgi:hypothetical protein